MKLPIAIKVFKDYYACPCCSNGKDVLNQAAIYHTSAFTHRDFCCKDCNKEFHVPNDIKLTPLDPVNTRKPFNSKENFTTRGA